MVTGHDIAGAMITQPSNILPRIRAATMSVWFKTIQKLKDEILVEQSVADLVMRHEAEFHTDSRFNDY